MPPKLALLKYFFHIDAVLPLVYTISEFYQFH